MYSEMEKINLIDKLDKIFDLQVEASYRRKKRNFLQIQKQVLLIEPKLRSSKWSKGTRIYVTVGNHNKILESLLIQIFCSVSKQFLTLSLLFKRFISEISNRLLNIEKRA